MHNEDLNKEEDPYIMAETPSLIHVKCKLPRCPFLIYFQWDDKTIDRSKDKKYQFEEPFNLTLSKVFYDYHDQVLHDKGIEQTERSDSEEEAEEDAAVPEAKQDKLNSMEWQVDLEI